MQCKDCLKEIDDKEYYNRSIEGICKKCRQKMSQIKYENKKFGTNKEYVPARLKNANTKIVNKKTNKVASTIKIIEEKEERIYDERIEKIVLKDIQDTFKNHNIEINSQETPPFNVFMDMFVSLIDINNGYMTQYKKAEEVFNMMEGDYQHAYEDAKTPEVFFERSKMFRCLLDQRRAIKNGIGQYSEIIDLLQDIVKKNPKILEEAKKAQVGLNRVIESQEGHYYKAKASELISREEFCVGKRDWAQWHVEIPLNGYYGMTVPHIFKRDCWADGENGAIENIKEYLKQKFPSCTYKEDKFKVERISDEKECP